MSTGHVYAGNVASEYSLASFKTFILLAPSHRDSKCDIFKAVLPDGLDQLPPSEILFAVILTLVIRVDNPSNWSRTV